MDNRNSCRGVATGICEGEARDGAKHVMTHGLSSMTGNSLVPNVSSEEREKPCTREASFLLTPSCGASLSASAPWGEGTSTSKSFGKTL